MRMAGQLGNAQRTTKHLKIVRVDLDRNLLLVNGDVPGHKNSVVLVKDSTRQPKGKK
jgi:large subunit ribosomal protein L3